MVKSNVGIESQNVYLELIPPIRIWRSVKMRTHYKVSKIHTISVCGLKGEPTAYLTINTKEVDCHNCLRTIRNKVLEDFQTVEKTEKQKEIEDHFVRLSKIFGKDT